MTIRRRIALGAAATLVLLLVLLALVPVLFRGPLEARAKAAVAANLDARVDWRRLDLGLFRDFPDLSLRLHDLTVVGTGVFAADTLLAASRLGVVLDLGSVLRGARGRGAFVVRSIRVDDPAAKLVVLEDGAANWDIVRPREPGPASGRALDVRLDEFAIRNGRVVLDDRQSGLAASLAGIAHELSGDFGRERFTLRTRTGVDTAAVRFAGVPYLQNVRLELAAEVAADMAAKTFTLRDNRVRLNDLVLRAEGTIARADSTTVLDLAFSAPRTEFRELLSLVPVLYAQRFATLQTAGTMTVRGHVRGRVGPHDFPAFALEATVADGMFRYPDLPLPARDIALQLSLTNAGGSPDSTVLRVPRFHVRLGDDVVEGALAVRTPVSDPDVDVRVNGRLDLSTVPRTIKLPDVQELSGTVVADAGMRARLSDLEQRHYDRVGADGRIEVRQLALSATALRQPVRIEEAVLRFTPQRAELSSFRGRAGASDVRMTGSLENVLAFALRRGELRGSVQVASARLDLNEWRSENELRSIAVPAGVDFTLEATADTVTFGQLTLRRAQGALRVKDRRLSLDEFRMGLLGGELVVTGFYETADPARPTFDVALRLDQLDIPAAFAGLRTVQAFAPVARYAQGRVSAQLELDGALGADMVPRFQELTGLGSLTTRGLILRDFPALDRLADALKVPQLQDPGFMDLQSSFAIRDGRLHVRPFDVRVGPLTMTVAGSNGIDQSLDYALALTLPRNALGEEADRAVSAIVSRTASAGFDLRRAETITLGVQLGGTVSSPAITTTFREAARSTAESVTQALQEQAAAKVDSAQQEARRQADAEAAKLLAEAEARAAAVREEAKTLADALRREAGERADSLEARAGSPAAKIGARLAADRLRKEADTRAEALVRDADARAEALLAEARRRAGVTTTGG